MGRRGWLVGLSCLLGSLLISLVLWAQPRKEPVSILMPAPFADATVELVEAFNREHPNIDLTVTRGPLETEAVSDLAISSLLLGNSPYDVLLMDVTWTPKYAKAGWLEPLDGWLGDDALSDLAPGAELGMPLMATSGASPSWPTWVCCFGARTSWTHLPGRPPNWRPSAPHCNSKVGCAGAMSGKAANTRD